MIAAIADRVVAVVRAGHRRRAWLSAGALVMTLVMATGYLLFGALQVNPLTSSYRVTIELPESAGLLPNQDVTLRGVRVGRWTGSTSPLRGQRGRQRELVGARSRSPAMYGCRGCRRPVSSTSTSWHTPMTDRFCVTAASSSRAGPRCR